MKRFLLTVAVLAFSAGAALAADPLANYYGNTLVVTGPDGMFKIWYKADKSYTGLDAKGAKISGTWAVTGDQICVSQTSPAPAAGQQKNCGNVAADKKVGDTWQNTWSDGKKYSQSLVAGS
jgi:hypothetical protein